MSFELGLIGVGLGLGLRHGVDWDHIAAISDVTGLQQNRRRAIWLGSLYAIGHASVVIALGVLALWLGSTLPESVDAAMQVVVGLTLLGLGSWLAYVIWRDGADYQLRSRWMLVFAGLRRLGRATRAKLGGPAKAPDVLRTHPETRPDGYAAPTVYGIGMIHGVGAETGSQVLLFSAAAGATSNFSGTLLLLAFVVGLIASNTAITLGSVFGFWGAKTNRRAYLAFGILTAIFSLAIGSMFVLRQGSLLPELLT